MAASAPGAALSLGGLVKEGEAAYFLKQTEVIFMRFIFFVVILAGFFYLYKQSDNSVKGGGARVEYVQNR